MNLRSIAIASIVIAGSALAEPPVNPPAEDAFHNEQDSVSQPLPAQPILVPAGASPSESIWWWWTMEEWTAWMLAHPWRLMPAGSVFNVLWWRQWHEGYYADHAHFGPDPEPPCTDC